LQDLLGKKLLDKKPWYPGHRLKKIHVRLKYFKPDGKQKNANLGRGNVELAKSCYVTPKPL